MGKNTALPRVRCDVFLELSLEWLKKDDDEAVCVVARIPGRKGDLVKSWRTLHGNLTDRQAEDLAAYVQRTALNAILTYHGVKGALPLG